MKSSKILGIDAMNIRDGGGITHLYEVLNCATDRTIEFDKIVVWGNDTCLEQLPNKSWLLKINPLPFKNSYWRSILWQIFLLGRSARKMKCNLLFIAGGSAITSFRPKVTICHNMLPFSPKAIKLYPYGRHHIKILMLHFIQLYTFRRVDGLIFLSKWAQEQILPLLSKSDVKSAVIPHGISQEFKFPNRVHRVITECTNENPFTLIYVSRIEPYKNQLQVIEAFDKLRKESGWNIQLKIIGLASDKQYFKLLNEKLQQIDPNGHYINYVGPVPYEKLGSYYCQADMGIFASSCENMPIILLEKMASGLPLICSNIQPMPDYLKDAGIYVDVSSVDKLQQSIRSLILDIDARTFFSHNGVELVQKYSWQNSSLFTFQMLFKMVN